MTAVPLPDNIARLQWNNRLKSGAMCIFFIAAMGIFALTLFLMVAVPVSLVPDSGITLAQMITEPKMQTRMLRFFAKIFFFAGGMTLYFIYRDINNIGTIFSASPLVLHSGDRFYRAVENMCISRGLKMPMLYVFDETTVPPQIVTAAVAQGVGGKSALVVTEGALNLSPALQEALAAQTVQRLYTKDTYFLTMFCFLGHFPFHVARSANIIARYAFWLPLQASDVLLKMIRPRMLNLRLQKLDAGAMELTKDAAPLDALASQLATPQQLDDYFYAPYLALFITKPQA
ncbi:MAG: hypothetical protein H3C49_08155 [Alphaproteobacteria bacterium]|nr:hypothetical protein [Alphaproteobacteria bacterium]